MLNLIPVLGRRGFPRWSSDRPGGARWTRPLTVALALSLLCLSSHSFAQQPGDPSATQLLAATRQARDARNFDRAEQLAREGMARFDDPVWPLTLALILADKGRSREALAILGTPRPDGLPEVERLMAEAYANLRGDDFEAAMAAYGKVLGIDPGNAEARQALAGIEQQRRVRGDSASAASLQARGDALLASRRPREALAAYHAALQIDPDNLAVRYGRVFALVESERFPDAISAADAIAVAQRPAGAGTEAEKLRDRDYAYAATLAANVRLWADLVPEAYARLKSLAAAAPRNADIRRSLVSVLNARGWRRQAAREAANAAALDPGSVATQIMLIDASLSRHRVEAAKAASEALLLSDPQNPRFRRLSREVAAAAGWAVEIELGPKWNEGGGIHASGAEWGSSMRVDTPRLGHGLGLFLLSDFSIAHPVEGKASRYRAGGGATFRGQDVSASIHAAQSWGSLSKGSVGFNVSWEPGDQLSLGISGEIFSSETPLRALHYGITANSLSAGLGWRRNEGAGIAAGVSLLSYSDGNDRLAGSLRGELRLWARPGFAITGRGGLWYARNSRPDVGPYFSPEWEFSGTGGLTISHMAWRSYEKSFSHALYADFGLQDQRRFRPMWIGSLRYEHRWRWNPWTEFYYWGLVDRRVYDGVAERGIGFRLGLRQRF